MSSGANSECSLFGTQQCCHPVLMLFSCRAWSFWVYLSRGTKSRKIPQHPHGTVHSQMRSFCFRFCGLPPLFSVVKCSNIHTGLFVCAVSCVHCVLFCCSASEHLFSVAGVFDRSFLQCYMTSLASGVFAAASSILQLQCHKFIIASHAWHCQTDRDDR